MVHNYHGLEWRSEKFQFGEMRNILLKCFADELAIFVARNIRKH